MSSRLLDRLSLVQILQQAPRRFSSRTRGRGTLGFVVPLVFVFILIWISNFVRPAFAFNFFPKNIITQLTALTTQVKKTAGALTGYAGQAKREQRVALKPAVLGTDTGLLEGLSFALNIPANFSSDVHIGKNLSVDGTASVSGKLVVTGPVDLQGSLSIGDGNTSINGVQYQFPATQGPASTVLTNNGEGTLTWSNLTVPSKFSDLTGIVPIAQGGTNNSVAYTSGSIIFSDGTKLTQDAGNLFYDASNHRLGILTTSPTAPLSVGSSSQFQVSSGGVVTAAGLTNSGTLTNSGAIIAPTSGDTINSLIINSGALSGVTGYTQGSGNFAMTGGGTFGTGTGAVSLNGNTTIASGKTLVISDLSTAGGVVYTNGSGKLLTSAAGTTGQCLISAGTTSPTWGACDSASANSPFFESNGTIQPLNSSEDLLVGGQASSSAKFAVLNVAAGTPTATLSAGTAGGAYLTASGTIQTTANQTLTLGGSSTGNITLSPLNGGGTITANGDIVLAAAKTLTIPALNTAGGLMYTTSTGQLATSPQGTAGQCIVSNGAGAPSWTGCGGLAGVQWGYGSGTVYPFNSTLDVLIGGQASTSAKFAFLNVDSGTPTASVSAGTAGGAYLTATGTLQTTASQALTLGGSSTGNILLLPKNSTGKVGINNATPNGILDVTGGATGKALVILNETGNQALFTASASSATKFTIANNGDIAATGAVTGLTGYTQDSGNFIVNGAGTFGTGTGTVSLNGPTTVTDNNSFKVASLNTAGGIVYTTATGQFLTSVVGSNGQCLVSNGTSAPTWGSCGASGASPFGESTGAIIPYNSTEDLLVGGQSSSSAKFAVLNVNNGTPTASVSAGSSGAAYLTAGGTLQSTINQTLTLGGNSTGNITLSPLNGAGVVTVNGTLTSTGAISAPTTSNTINNLVINSGALSGITGYTQTSGNFAHSGTGTFGTGTGAVSLNGDVTVVSGKTLTVAGLNTAGGVTYTNGSGQILTSAAGSNGQCLVSNGASAPSWGSCGASGASPFGESTGAIIPYNSTEDMLIGGQATSSAKFAFLNVNSGTPTASVSAGAAGATYLTAAGTVQTTANQTLTVGGATTGNITLSPLNGSGTVSSTGNISVASGKSYQVNGTDVLTGSTLGTSIVNSSLTSTGALTSGSIASGFGTIATANTITGTTLNGTTGVNTGASAGTQRIDASGNLVNIGTIAASGAITAPTSTNTINGLIISSGALSGITGYTQTSGNFAMSGTGTFGTGTGAISLNGNTTIASGKTLTVSDLNTAGGINYTNSSGQILTSAAGSSGQCLTSGGTGAPTWGNCGGAAGIQWGAANGAVYPLNSTLDLLVGGQASSSAKAAFLNINSGTPTATLSAGAAGGSYLTAAGTLQTTANQTLTVGGATTGNITLSPLNGSGTVTSTGALNLSSGKTYQINGADVLSGTTLGTGVTGSSLTSTGALASGSIASGFGTIATANTITGTTLNGTTGVNTGASAGTQRIDASGNLVNIGTIGASGAITAPTSTNTINNLIINSGALSGITGYTQTSGNFAMSGTGTFGTGTGAISLNGNTTIASGKTLTVAGLNTAGGVVYTDTNGALGTSAAGTSGQCLTSGGTGAPTWAGCAASSGTQWTNANGALYPYNSTLDLLIGAQASSSAKFAVLNINSGTPTATLSAGAAGGSYLTAAGTLQTTANQTLTVGGATTGNITLSPLNGSGTVTSTGTVNVASGKTYQVNGTDVLSGSTLGTGVTTSSLTTVGALSSGSIASGFGTIATANTITGTTLNGTTGVNTGASAGTQRIDASGNLVNIGTIAASGAITGATATNTINGLIINSGALSGITGYTQTSGNFAHSGTGTFGTGTGAVSLNGDVTVASGKTLTVAGLNTAGGVTYTNGSGQILTSAAGSSGQCLISGGTGAPTWTGCAAASGSTFQLASGTIQPLNSTVDFLLGGQASDSAKFAVLNLNSGTPTASVSAGSAGGAYLTAAGTLQTTANQSLTIGGATTGNINLNPLNSSGVVTVNGTLTTGAISAPTSSNTINSLIINSGALSGITGYTQTSGNVAISGTGTFGTGTGAISLNGNTTIASGKTLTVAGLNTAGGVVYTDTNGALGTSAAGSSGQCLISGGTGAPTWTGCAAASGSTFQLASGTIQPLNSTVDFLVGGQASDSAKFAVLNVNSGTPTASVSAGAAGGSYLTAAGTLQTTANQTLTIGGNTTGNVNITGLNGSGSITLSSNTTLAAAKTFTIPALNTAGGAVYTNSSGQLLTSAAGTSGQCLISGGTGAPTWTSCGGAAGSVFSQGSGAIFPLNSTVDFLIGGQASDSAKAAFLNINSGTPTASVSAGATGGTYLAADGTLQTTANQTLTVGGATTGNITLSPLNGSGKVTSTGTINVATGKTYQVNGTDVLSGSTLGTGVTTSSLTTVGALSSGSIASGFGTIATANTITGTTLNGTTGVNTGASAGTQRIDASGNLVNIGTIAASGAITGATATNTINGLIINSGALSGITGYTQTSGNFAHSGTGTFGTGTGAVSLNGDVTVASGKTLTVAGLNTAGGINYTNSSGQILTSAAGSSGQCLTSGGTGAPTWAGCAASSGTQWGAGSGALYPFNSTLDMLIGGQASSSAKFAFLNVNSGTPTASVSAGAAGATYLTAAGTVQTTANQTLTVGGATTGNIALTPLNGSGTVTVNGSLTTTGAITAPTSTNTINSLIINSGALSGITGYTQTSGNVAISGTGTFGTGTGAVSLNGNTTIASGKTLTLTSLNTAGAIAYTDTNGTLGVSAQGSSGQCLVSGGTGAPTWTSCGGAAGTVFSQTSGAIVPLNSTVDFLIGGQATTSAKAAFLNINSGTPTASVSAGSAGGAYITADGTIQTTANQSLTIGGATTGNITLSPLNGSGKVASTGTLNLSSGKTYQINGADVLTGSSLGTGVTGSSLTSTGALASGSIASGFGTIATANTITGTTINGTTGVNTGASAGTQRIDASGNLVNIGTISASGAITGATATDTINGLIINAGALSGITGYTQTSGNVAISGTGTFGTGTGAISLNGNTTIASGKTLTLTSLNTAGAIAYTDTNGTLGVSAQGSSGQCLLSGGTGTPTWGGCAASAGTQWTNANGALYPFNSTLDLLVGGQASTSAKFAVLNINSGTPTATLSAGAAGGSYLTAAGTLQTTANQKLTIGGATTGDITLSPLNGSGTVLNTGTMNLSSGKTYQINGADVLTGSSLGTGVTGSSLTSTGALASGSIASGFGTIATANTITGTTINGTTGINTGATAGTQRIDASGNLVNIGTIGASGAITAATSTNTINNLVINSGALSGITGYTQTSGNFAHSGTGTFGTGTGAVSLNGNTTIATGKTLTLTDLNTAGGVVYTNGSGVLATSLAGSDGQCLLSAGALAPVWGSCSAGNSSPFQTSGGTVQALNSTVDFLLGGQASSSAKFAVLNLNSGTPTASVSAGSAGAAYLTADGTLQTTANQQLNIGGSTTGNININPLNGTGKVGINNATPVAKLDLTGKITGKALAIFNESGDQAIFTASASSVPKFTIENNGDLTVTGAISGLTGFSQSSGNFSIAGAGTFGTGTGAVSLNGDVTVASGKTLTIAGLNTAGAIAYTSTTGQVGVSAQGSSGQCLISGGTGAPTWVGCASQSGNQWTAGSGAVYPYNSTLDLLVGGQASTSAKFAILNVNTGTPVASVSAGANGAAYITADGTIQTTKNLTLTIGGATTGNINITGLNGSGSITLSSNTTLAAAKTFTIPALNTAGGIVYTTSTGQLATSAAGSSSQCLLSGATGAPTWSGCAAAAGTQWTTGSGALYPFNSTLDMLVGGQASTSAKFAVLNVNNGTPTASVSAGASGATYTTATGTIATTKALSLTLGASTTGDIVLAPAGSTAVTVKTGGKVGIGNTSPTGLLDVSGAVTGKALTILNNTGNQNTLTASSSGTTVFQLGKQGDVTIGNQTQYDVYNTMYGDINQAGGVDANTSWGENMKQTFIYDTTKDNDYGAWTNSTTSQQLSWYTETKDDANNGTCTLTTFFRCGASSFPKKAVIVTDSGGSLMVIIDAITGKPWMKINQGSGQALSTSTNNTITSVFALNGSVYVGMTGTASIGIVEFNFKTDQIYKYNTSSRSLGNANIANRNGSVTYGNPSIPQLAIGNTKINAMSGAVIDGKTYIAAATSDGIYVINKDDKVVLNYDPQDASVMTSVKLMNGTLYGLNSSMDEVDKWYNVQNDVASHSATPADKIFGLGGSPSLFSAAPTISTTAPDALYVASNATPTQGNSNDTIYVGSTLGLSALTEGQNNAPAIPSSGYGTWSTTGQGQLGTALHAEATPSVNIGGTNYIYSLGGTNGAGTYYSIVYKATIDSAGNIGAWSTTSQGQLPAQLSNADAQIVNIGGTYYIYVLGGNTASYVSTVYKATIDASGNIGAFATTSQTQLPAVASGAGTEVVNIAGQNYIYYIGGITTASAYFSTVYRATIDSSGNIGAWSTSGQSQLPVTNSTFMHASANIGGKFYLYTIGAFRGSSDSTVYKAQIDSSGNVGTWSTTNQAQFPFATYGGNSTVVKNGTQQYIYAVMGFNATTPGYSSVVYRAALNAQGDVQSWVADSNAPVSLYSGGDDQTEIVNVGGTYYLYGITGYNGSATTSTVYKARLNSPSGVAKYYTQHYITEDMIGDIRGTWPLDSNYGSGVSDASFRGHTLTNGGTTPTYTAAGVRDQAGNFSGSTSVASSTASSLLYKATDPGLTVSAWVFPTTLTTTAATREMFVSADANTASKVSWGIGTKGDGTNAFAYCYANGSSFTEVNSGVPLKTYDWTHIVETVDGNGNINCYVNGALRATGSVASAETPTRFQLGATQSTTAFNAVRGTMDEVMVSATPASADQVYHMYIMGLRAQSQSYISNTNATSASSTTYTDTAFKLGTNQYVGAVFEMNGGTGSGQTRTIVANTATAFTVSPAFGTTPDTTSDMIIKPHRYYGATDTVTAVALTDDPTSKRKLLYVGTNSGSGTGGLSVINADTDILVDAYHITAGKVSDDNANNWATTTGFDDINTVAAGSRMFATGANGHYWIERNPIQITAELDALRNDLIALKQAGSSASIASSQDDAGITKAQSYQVIRKGWGYQTALADTGTIVTKVINLGTSFDEAPIVLVNGSGSISGVDPTSLMQCTTNGALSFAATKVSTNEFTAFGTTSGSSWTGYRACFTWIAIGSVHGTGNAALSPYAAGADLAEYYPTDDRTLHAGEVVKVSSEGQAKVVRADEAYDPASIGIIATKPAIVMGDSSGMTPGYKEDQFKATAPAVAVALAGRVPVKVSLENGPIEPGDYLTTSSTPGYAMKALAPGAVIGKALERFDGKTTTAALGSDKATLISSLQSTVNEAKAASGSADLKMVEFQTTTASESGETTTKTVITDPDIAALDQGFGTILAFVNTSYADPENLNKQVSLTDIYRLVSAPADTQNASDSAALSPVSRFLLQTPAGRTITKTVTASDGLIANLTVGTLKADSITTKKLAADEVSIKGQSLSDYIAQMFKELNNGNASASASHGETASESAFVQLTDTKPSPLPNATLLSTEQTASISSILSKASSLRLNMTDVHLSDSDVVLNTTITKSSLYSETLGNSFIGGNLGVAKSVLIGNGLTISDRGLDFANDVPADQRVLTLLGQGKGVLSILGDRLKITDQGEAILNADLKLNGRVMFADQDMAGYAKILRGDREVRVDFGRTYEEKPVVTVNASDTETRFAVKEISTTGFVIRMSADAKDDFDFTWTALAIKSPKTFESKSSTNQAASVSGTVQLTVPGASLSGSVAGASTSAAPIILPTLVTP